MTPVVVPPADVPSTISITPVLFVGTSNSFTNSWNLAGAGADLMVNGDFECNSQSVFSASVVVTGNAYFTNNCVVHGNVWVKGSVRIDSNPEIKGSLNSKGGITFQSTAKIGGDVVTEQTFTVIDGKTIDQLYSSGSVKGKVFQTSKVKEFLEPTFPNYSRPTQNVVQWDAWMKTQAAQNPATPNWSDVYNGKGCSISPGASWSLAGDIEIRQDTTIDSINACPNGVSFGNGGTVKLYGDFVLYARSFDTPNGIKFVSGDGKSHKVRIISPSTNNGTARCDDSATIRIGNGSTFDSKLNTFFYTESKLNINGSTTMTGKIYAGCVPANGNITVNYAPNSGN